MSTSGFACVGDCDGSGDVTVNELIVMVNITLGSQVMDACVAGDKNGDAQISIDEIIVAVNAALSGCGGTATPTPTPTPACRVNADCSATYPYCGPDGRCWTLPCSDVCSDGISCCGGTYPHCGPDGNCWTLPCATLCGATCCGPTQQCQTDGTCAVLPGTPTPTPQPTVTPGPHLYCRAPSGGLPIPDDDPLGVGDSLTIADAFPITDAKVRVQITHAWVGDLVVTLHHVDSLSGVTLIDRPGVSGVGQLGCDRDDILCTLDDAATAAVDDQCADPGPALAGTLRPSQPLSKFNGESSAGDWILSVYDQGPGITGNLVGWCLEMNATAPPFTYGPLNTVSVNTVAATEVADPTTGVTFVFPQGGHGTLTTATIVSGPFDPAFGGAGFHFEFSGTELVQFKLPKPAAADTQVYAFGYATGCLDGGPPRDSRWFGWPETAAQDDVLLYDIPAAPPATTTPGATTTGLDTASVTATVSGDFFIKNIVPGDLSYQRQNITRQQIEQDLQALLGEMPASLQSAAQQQLRTTFRYRIYDSSLNLSDRGNAYSAFSPNWRRQAVFDPHFDFNLASVDLQTFPRTVAHETGHMLNHVVLRAQLGNDAGDAEMRRIVLDLAPPAGHSVGDVRAPRVTTTEEPAFVSQYYFVGVLDTVKPNDVFIFRNTIDNAPTPDKVDFPSVEGFGFYLLANLARADASIVDWSGKTAAAPPIGLSWGDVWAIIATGATNINEYRANIQAFLDAKGQGDRLGINAERLGWSYHAKGTVYATGTRNPVAGVTVTSLVKIDGTEYTASQATTDAGGQFTLPRLIPGCSMLRVAKDQHTVDYSTCNGWDSPTTEEITLSDSFISVEPPPGNPTVTVDPPSGSTFTYDAGAWFTITATPVPGTTITRIEAWRVKTEYSDYFLGQSFDSNTLSTGDNDPHADGLGIGYYRAWVHDSRGGTPFKFDFSYTFDFSRHE